ncbi:MAG: metallophosphoesterase family protein [Flavobacteriaceae bacterium]
MKSRFVFLLLIMLTTSIQSQDIAQLHFNANKEFKVVQFTDTHVNVELGKNMDVFVTVKKILDMEKPDLVVLTGDVATDGNPEKTYKEFEAVFTAAKTPWIVTLGNHDSQADLSRKEVADFLQNLNYCLNNDQGETYGNSNFVYPVRGRDSKNQALIYIMDSNAYSTLKPEVDGWGWFDNSQVSWYKEKSKEFTRKNNDKPLPAIAFFHIPLPEYYQAWKNKKVKAIGKRKEQECGPEINTGMFAAMLEAKDVMGTFVGHDHNNDYIGVHYNMALAYGRVTKTKTYNKAPVEGARIIVLKEGERSFDTWIREVNGKKVYSCSWPSSFVE